MKKFISQYFKPSLYLPKYKDIDLLALKSQDIKLIICDLDNTLVPHFKILPTRENIKWIQNIKELDMKFVLLSNNKKKRVKKFAQKAGVDEYYGAAKKPLKKTFMKILNKHKIQPKNMVIIGDQIVTDIWLANRVKCNSILIQPLISSNNGFNGFNKILEKFIYSKIERQDIVNKNDHISTELENNYELL